MLSQQFPGLINPALLSAAGFPGFAHHGNSHAENGIPASTSANTNIQQFPGLQQLLVGSKTPSSHISLPNLKDGTDSRQTDEENEDREEGEIVKIRKCFNSNAIRKEQNKNMSTDSERKRNHGESGRKVRHRRFKCSKCNEKFRRRDICLRHIHQTHSTILPAVPRRQLGFLSSNSPKKSIHSANKVTIRVIILNYTSYSSFVYLVHFTNTCIVIYAATCYSWFNMSKYFSDQ